MCFICKTEYDDYMNQSKNPHYIKVFREKVHTEERTTEELYIVFDEVMSNEFSHHNSTMKPPIRKSIKSFIEYVSEVEHVTIQDPTPTYRMHKDGTYEKVI